MSSTCLIVYETSPKDSLDALRACVNAVSSEPIRFRFGLDLRFAMAISYLLLLRSLSKQQRFSLYVVYSYPRVAQSRKCLPEHCT